MSNQDYQPRLTTNRDGSVYALIVLVHAPGDEQVIHGYKGRHFKTEKAALRSCNNYIAKHGLND